jgi:hypothetical protein
VETTRKETTRKTWPHVGYDSNIYVRETGWGDMHWINLAQDRDQWKAVLNTALNLRVPYDVGKFLIR